MIRFGFISEWNEEATIIKNKIKKQQSINPQKH